VYRAYGCNTKLEEHAPYEFEIVPPYGYMLKLLHAGQTNLAELLDMPESRCTELMMYLNSMRLIDDKNGVTDLGYRVTSVPVAVPFASMLLRAADEGLEGATLLALCVFVAVLETGNTSRLFWIPPEAKSPERYRKHFDEHFNEWVRSDDLEAFVNLFFNTPQRATTAWCRLSSFNDQMVKAVQTTTKALVYHAFYCERGSETAVFQRFSKTDQVDFDALRRLVVREFPERILTFTQRGRQMTYSDGNGQSWSLDAKRRLSNFWEFADKPLPHRVCAMTLFECDARRGGVAHLASCVVIDPDSFQDNDPQEKDEQIDEKEEETKVQLEDEEDDAWLYKELEGSALDFLE
jgi:HrpA-like RNA helicase